MRNTLNSDPNVATNGITISNIAPSTYSSSSGLSFLLDFDSAVQPTQTHVNVLCQALSDNWSDFRCNPPSCRMKGRKRGEEILSTLEVNVQDSSGGSGGLPIWVWIVVGVGALLFLIAVVVLIVVIYKKKKESKNYWEKY